MRNTLILLLITFFQSYATISYSQTTLLSLDLKDATVANVLEEIEEQSDFYFLFNAKLIDIERKVSVSVNDQKIFPILDQLFSNTNVEYVVYNQQIVLSPGEYIAGLKKQTQQPKVITGTVTDENGDPVIGATVLVKGTTQGTITDTEGKFSIADVPEDGVLVFSFVGMRTQEMNVSGRILLEIIMEQEAIGLEEVVAIGYETQSRKKLTSSISDISGEQMLSGISIGSIGEGLKGKISGARVYTLNNTPGAEPIIRIRGGSSINGDDSPLILIDGVERSLTDINPNDIESISVLKDAASTAIYGSRASNGIVLVTTKTGSLKAPTVTYEMNVGHQVASRNYDYMNAADWLSYMRPALAISNLKNVLTGGGNAASAYNDENSIYTTRYLLDGEAVPEGYKSMPDPLDPSKTLIFQDNDFQDVTYNPALWQNYYLGINGGNQYIRYLGSIGYTDDDGIAVSTGWTRFNVRGRLDANISEKISVSTNIDFSESKTNEFENQRNVLLRGTWCPPTQRVYWDDGTPVRGYNATSPSPIWYDYTRDDDQLENRIGINNSLRWNILKGLLVTINGSYFNNTWQRDYFERAHYFNNSRPSKSSFINSKNLKFESYLNYNKVVNNEHTFSALAGYSFTKYSVKELYASASGASSDKITTLNAGPIKTDATTTLTEETLIGYFGRFSYDYKAKYLLSATLRADGSSRFIKGTQWGYFPGISLGWIISEEPFMKSINKIQTLKLRTSYGQTGNNAIDLYDAFGKYTVDIVYNGNSSTSSISMANKNLTWETSTQFDLGIDLGLSKNRIILTVDYFNKITKNLLFSKELPNTSGYQSILSNIGSVRFYGFDAELNTINIRKNRFEWRSNFTWSFVKNEVLKLPDNNIDKNRIGGITLADGSSYGGIAEGEPLYRFYGYKVDYIIQTEEEAASALYDELSGGYDPETGGLQKGRKFPGDYEWCDRDGNGRINSLDQFELGVYVPHSTGGLGNIIRYKSWSCNIYLDWALGHSVYDVKLSGYMDGSFEGNKALVNEVKQTWKQPGDNAKYALFNAGSPALTGNNYNRNSSKYAERADYLCIREFSIRYSLPQNIIGKFGVSNWDVYLSGNNLYYFTKLIGLCPEAGAATTYTSAYMSYPPVRRISIGVKLEL